jgi:rhodanese-related sulfurtransferase
MTTSTTFESIRAALLEKREIALLDVREEDIHAQGHPLFAANLSLARIELEAAARLPRRDVPIVTLDGGEGLAEQAAEKLAALGYANVTVLDGGIEGWRAAGGELFRDVNGPSKSFGELVDSVRHPPMLEPQAVKSLIDAKADVVIIDVRRFDEYQRMSIPTGISIPGAELVLRVPDLAPNPETQVIVGCAGRTRSIIAAQSLINAGLPNPVAALKNGTMGWTLAGLALDHGASRRFLAVSERNRRHYAERARALADRAGVARVSLADIEPWRAQRDRTTYFIDVRDPAEFDAAHLPGFRSVAGGQLVQETEMTATVRGARIVLADDDGVRANMTASWLAQMDWEVFVLDIPEHAAWSESGPCPYRFPPPAKRYLRPYEGTNASLKAMEDYLNWEYGLVEQLRRDGTHGFRVL